MNTEIKNLLAEAIKDEDARAITRLLGDAVECKVVTSAVATKLRRLADVMYTGSRAAAKAASVEALALLG